MTILGKILVFINLVFSVIVAGLVIVVYMKSTPWAVEYDKLSKRYEVAQANSEQHKKARLDAETDRDDKVAKAESKLKEAFALLETKVTDLENLKRDFNLDRQKLEKADSAMKAAQLEVERRAADVAKMRETLKGEMDKNIELVKLNNQLKERETEAQLKALAVMDRNKQLEGQVQDLARDNARIKTNFGATTTTAAPRSTKNPPAENVEGLIQMADQSGLVKLTIGSDAGLARGNTLEVFRLARIPSQSKYLGTIRILEVTANEAVGQPLGRPLAPLQAGDHVASRIPGT